MSRPKINKYTLWNKTKNRAVKSFSVKRDAERMLRQLYDPEDPCDDEHVIVEYGKGLPW